MSIEIQPLRLGGAVVERQMRITGDIRVGSGGAADPVWGQITGTLSDQADLAAALAEKAAVAAVTALSEAVNGKMDKVAGSLGQFMVYGANGWQGQTMAEWQGGDY